MTLLTLLRNHRLIVGTTIRLAFTPAAREFASQPRAATFDAPDPRST